MLQFYLLLMPKLMTMLLNQLLLMNQALQVDEHDCSRAISLHMDTPQGVVPAKT